VTLGLVRSTRVGVSTTRVGMTTAARVSARRCLRMSATTWIRVTAAEVTTWMRGASAGVAVRSPSRVAARVTWLIARYRMRTTRAAVVLGTTAVRYRASMRATGSMRGNDPSAGELTRSRCRSHSGVAMVERRTQLSIPGSGVFVITL
jgi:hypothetical protein